MTTGRLPFDKTNPSETIVSIMEGKYGQALFGGHRKWILFILKAFIQLLSTCILE
jgi:hypothetical protein